MPESLIIRGVVNHDSAKVTLKVTQFVTHFVLFMSELRRFNLTVTPSCIGSVCDVVMFSAKFLTDFDSRYFPSDC